METIGELLKKRRSDRGLALSDAHEGTKITSQNLAALEEDRFDAFPNRVYARAFLRDYANYLGLDSSDLLQRYEQEWGQPLTVAPKPKRKPWFAKAVVAIVILAGVGYGAYYIGTEKPFKSLSSPASHKTETVKPEKPNAEPKKTPENATPAAGNKTASTTPAPTNPAASTDATKPVVPDNSATAAQPAEIAPGTVVVQISATQQTYVLVKRDGKKELETILKPGQKATFSGKKIFVLSGNAGGVDLTVNNKHIGKMGASGAVSKKTFTPEQ